MKDKKLRKFKKALQRWQALDKIGIRERQAEFDSDAAFKGVLYNKKGQKLRVFILPN